MKRAVVFVNGELSDLTRVRREIRGDDLLVGVDGGCRLVFKLGFKPDVVVGDMDSVSREDRKKLERFKIPVIKYARDKDLTDTELGVDYVVKRGIKDILIVGLLGRRVDHLLANVMGLIKIVKMGVRVRVVEGKQEMWLVRDRTKIKGKKGDLVSLIPLSTRCSGVMTKGLKWRLENESLYADKARGVSNVMLGKMVEIRLRRGWLLVVKTG